MDPLACSMLPAKYFSPVDKCEQRLLQRDGGTVLKVRRRPGDRPCLGRAAVDAELPVRDGVSSMQSE